jgi:hypothetical protein
MKSLGLLTMGSAAIWLIVAYPALRWWGEVALVYSAVAAILCWVPTAATLIWSQASFRAAPEQQLLAVMGGTGVRLGVVLGGGMALFYLEPYFKQMSFWIWVVVFYLITLTLEMVILLGRHSATPRSPNH